MTHIYVSLINLIRFEHDDWRILLKIARRLLGSLKLFELEILHQVREERKEKGKNCLQKVSYWYPIDHKIYWIREKAKAKVSILNGTTRKSKVYMVRSLVKGAATINNPWPVSCFQLAVQPCFPSKAASNRQTNERAVTSSISRSVCRENCLTEATTPFDTPIGSDKNVIVIS